MKAAIFDYDGTLVHLNIDFGRIRLTLEQFLRDQAIDPEPLRALYILEMIEKASKHIAADDPLRGQSFCCEALRLVTEHEVAAARRGKVVPGVVDMLMTIKDRGVKIGIITRNCDKAVRITLPNIEDICDTFIPRDEVSRVKPHPDHLVLALRKMHVKDPEQCLMVGDHILDIEAGKRMRMKTAGVLTGNTTREQFIRAGADFIVTDVTQIPACIFAEQEL